MAGYTADLGLGGFTNWFMAQYEEELFMRKDNEIYQWQNGRIEVKSVAAPQNNFNSLLEVFQATLVHKQEVSTRFYDLMNIALEEKEHSTKSFLQWFIDEQVEEATVGDMINKIKFVKDSGLYLLDQEAAKRNFNAPSL